VPHRLRGWTDGLSHCRHITNIPYLLPRCTFCAGAPLLPHSRLLPALQLPALLPFCPPTRGWLWPHYPSLFHSCNSVAPTVSMPSFSIHEYLSSACNVRHGVCCLEEQVLLGRWCLGSTASVFLLAGAMLLHSMPLQRITFPAERTCFRGASSAPPCLRPPLVPSDRHHPLRCHHFSLVSLVGSRRFTFWRCVPCAGGALRGLFGTLLVVAYPYHMRRVARTRGSRTRVTCQQHYLQPSQQRRALLP